MPKRPKNARGKGDGDSRLDPHRAGRVPWSEAAAGGEMQCVDLVPVTEGTGY